MDPILNIKKENEEIESQKEANFIPSDFVKVEYLEDQTTKFENCKSKLKVSKKHLLSYNCQSELDTPNQNNIYINEEPFVSDLCNRIFGSNELKQPRTFTSNEKTFVCELCDKAFRKNYELKRHNIIHTNERPFVCDVCDKAFKTNQHLRQHKMTHTNERTIPSSSAKRKYPNSNTERTYPTSNAEKTYPTSNAEKTYPTSNAEKPYPTSNIERTYPNSSAETTCQNSKNAERTCPISSAVPKLPTSSSEKSPTAMSKPSRLIGRHFPDYCPSSEKRARPLRRCVQCQREKRKKKSSFWCPKCKVGLCVAPCFRLWHTKL